MSVIRDKIFWVVALIGATTLYCRILAGGSGVMGASFVMLAGLYSTTFGLMLAYLMLLGRRLFSRHRQSWLDWCVSVALLISLFAMAILLEQHFEHAMLRGGLLGASVFTLQAIVGLVLIHLAAVTAFDLAQKAWGAWQSRDRESHHS